MKDLHLPDRIAARGWLLATSGLVLALLSACGSGAATPESTAQTTQTSTSNSASSKASATESPTTSGSEGGSALVYEFPTGPAVTVPEGYGPPDNRVDHTGAYLPANGKPTLVFVDAIW